MAVDPLDGADLPFQQPAAWLAAHMLQPLSKDALEPVNDLSATLDDKALPTW